MDGQGLKLKALPHWGGGCARTFISQVVVEREATMVDSGAALRPPFPTSLLP